MEKEIIHTVKWSFLQQFDTLWQTLDNQHLWKWIKISAYKITHLFTCKYIRKFLIFANHLPVIFVFVLHGVSLFILTTVPCSLPWIGLLTGLTRKRKLVQKFISNLRKQSIAHRLDKAASSSAKLQRRVSRQESVHDQEEAQCHLSPRLEGRIYLLNDQVKSISEEICPNGIVKHTKSQSGIWSKFGLFCGLTALSLGLIWSFKRRLNK